MTADHPAGTLDPAAVEHLLRDHLVRRADAADPSPAPVAAVTVRAGARERRRVLVAAVVVTGLVLGGAAAARPWLDGTSRGLPATSDPGPDGRWTLADVPTRGDLAGSGTWHAAARDALRRAGQEEARLLAGLGQKPPAELPRVDHVIFAGRLPQGVVMLVTIAPQPSVPAPYDTRFRVLWSPTGHPGDLALEPFGGPVGATSYVSDRPAPTEVAAAAVTARDGTPYIVAVPLVRATTVSVSAGPVVDATGIPRRTWSGVPVTDGAAVAPLDRTVAMRVPLVTVDGGRPSLVATRPANTRPEMAAFADRLARRWGLGGAPSASVLREAFDPLLEVVPADRLVVDPVFHGRELPSTSDVVAALVRLDDGSLLHVAALGDDGDERTKAVMQLIAANPVPRATATTTPVTWLDDESSAGGGSTLHARARLALPGAARVEFRDVGATPCTTDRLLGAATTDANGLGTAVVDLPGACGQYLTLDDMQFGPVYPTIVGIAFDEHGREIGRSFVRAQFPNDLPDTRDYAVAASHP